MKRTLSLVMLLAGFVPFAAAQRFGHPTGAVGVNGSHRPRTLAYGYPFFFADYGATPQTQAATPPIIVERKVIEPDRPTEPLMIEWNGDRFVRYGSVQTAAEQSDYVASSSGVRNSAVHHDLPPATLVFRDGRRELVSDYVITGGVLYVHAQPWEQTAERIRISALDLPATFKANRDGGVNFALPATFHDVVTRP